MANLDKEKEIKFFQCIGDPLIQEGQVQEILKERENYWNDKLRDSKV